jgi:hypothetical protein
MIISDKYIHPTVFARKMSIIFNAAINDAELRFKADSFLKDLTQSLRNEGCELIGHIKGLFAAGVAGYLMFSITSHNEPVHFKGELNAEITRAVLTLNIIVYGVGHEIVKNTFKKAFQELCATES